jgi:hypothetical protein
MYIIFSGHTYVLVLLLSHKQKNKSSQINTKQTATRDAFSIENPEKSNVVHLVGAVSHCSVAHTQYIHVSAVVSISLHRIKDKIIYPLIERETVQIRLGTDTRYHATVRCVVIIGESIRRRYQPCSLQLEIAGTRDHTHHSQNQLPPYAVQSVMPHQQAWLITR